MLQTKQTTTQLLFLLLLGTISFAKSTQDTVSQLYQIVLSPSLNSQTVTDPEAFSPLRFFKNLNDQIHQVEDRLDSNQWMLFSNQIQRIFRRTQFTVQNSNTFLQAELYSQLREDVQRLVHKLNQNLADHDVNASLVDKLVRDAKNAPSEAKLINEKMHVYGTQTWTSATGYTATIGGVTKFYPGWNSCARVVSAIMKHTGYGNGIYNGVRKYESYLQGKGFKQVKYDDVEKGDIVIWAKGGLNHIGIYTGWGINMEGPGWTTVDNWSISGEPEHRPLNRKTLWGWEIRKILRPNR